MPKPRYEQSNLAKGFIKADQASALAAEMVVPAGVGALIDWRFGTVPWGSIIGCAVGFALLMTHLVQLANRSAAASSKALAERRKAGGGDRPEPGDG